MRVQLHHRGEGGVSREGRSPNMSTATLLFTITVRVQEHPQLTLASRCTLLFTAPVQTTHYQARPMARAGSATPGGPWH